MTGPVGIFYRQFSITMATSIVLSGPVALTLTPVLCAMILKPHSDYLKKRSLVDRALDKFNSVFGRATDFYVRILRKIVNRRLVPFGILLVFGLDIMGFQSVLPTGFIPNEDQGMIYAIVQTPPGATLERTNEISRRLQAMAEEVDGIKSVSSLAGYEILTEGRGSNAGTCLINLENWSKRDKSVHEIIEELEEKTQDIGAIIEYFESPAVPGYGAAGGVTLRLLDKTNSSDYKDFERINSDFMGELGKRPELTGLFTFFSANYPEYELVIDNKRAMQRAFRSERPWRL